MFGSMARRQRFGYGPLVWKGHRCATDETLRARAMFWICSVVTKRSINSEPCGPRTQRLVQFPAKANLASVLHQLEQERARLSSQLGRLNSALSALNGRGNVRTGRTVSAADRARIAAAQRARWAKVKGRKVVSITARKRTMS